MKPMIHAENSAKKFGGKASDYIKIHNWFDQTKAHFPDQRHRAILHSSFGIFLCEQQFGEVLKNSDGKEVSVRDIGEQHVLEDLNTIPTVQDWLTNMNFQDWMTRDEPKTKKVKVPSLTLPKQPLFPPLKMPTTEFPKPPHNPGSVMYD